MKETQKKVNVLHFIAFISLVVFAVLQVFCALKSVIQLGAVLTNILETVKNLGIILVFGITAWEFVSGRSKGFKITYWICLVIFILATIGLWVFNK